MKNKNLSKILVVTSIVGGSLFMNAQTNVFPPTLNAGIGITSPVVDLHIVGVTEEDGEVGEGGEVNLKSSNQVKGEIIVSNTFAGADKTDGFKITQLNSTTKLVNQEEGLMILKTGATNIQLDATTERVAVGIGSFNGNEKGAFNVITNGDNGMYVRCIGEGKVGLTVEVREDEDVAIKVIDGSDASNFSVLKNGQVYARRYTTTLANIPDYVFADDYKLMSIDSLSQYIETENHLPNIPSAEEYTEEGVDLGEMNRLLLEKVEELTLYVIQLNTEIELLKETK